MLYGGRLNGKARDQTPLVQLQWNKMCSINSVYTSQILLIGFKVQLLAYKFSTEAKVLWHTFHQNNLIFGGLSKLQMNFQIFGKALKKDKGINEVERPFFTSSL